MAKRKSHKKKTHRRRRVGATLSAGSPLVVAGAAVLSYFIGDEVNGVVNSVVPASIKNDTTKAPKAGKIMAIGQVGIGTALVLSKRRKTMLKSILAGVLIGTGVKRARNVFATGATTIGGYGSVDVVSGARVRMNGYGKVDVINGYTPNQALNGYTPNQALNGAYRKPLHSRIMGSVDKGSGISTGSELMG
jgi:hypothetical protein